MEQEIWGESFWLDEWRRTLPLTPLIESDLGLLTIEANYDSLITTPERNQVLRVPFASHIKTWSEGIYF